LAKPPVQHSEPGTLGIAAADLLIREFPWPVALSLDTAAPLAGIPAMVHHPPPTTLQPTPVVGDFYLDRRSGQVYELAA